MLYSVNMVSKKLGIGRTLIYSLIKAGELQVVKLGGRTLITPESIAQLIENNKTPRIVT